MDKEHRRQLRKEYNKIKIYMGVIKVTNTSNGKMFVSGFPNLKNKWLTLKAHMESGRHPNAAFQKDWNTFGADAFTYEVLEQKATDTIADVPWEVKMMEKSWLLKLQPFGEKGYNKPPKM